MHRYTVTTSGDCPSSPWATMPIRPCRQRLSSVAIFLTCLKLAGQNISYFKTAPLHTDDLRPSLKYIDIIRYREFRSGPEANVPYSLSLVFWHILAARLILVIVLEVTTDIPHRVTFKVNNDMTF